MTTRKTHTAVTTVAALLWLALPTPPAADAAETGKTDDDAPATLGEAIREGTFSLGLRYRYENVSDDGLEKEARASTLRTALGYATRPYRGWSFVVEAVNVAELGNDLYNNAGAGDLANGVTGRPVVADPALTEVSQVFLRFERGGTTATLGRREINLGDHRFVGNVGWRQNHQEFDAFTLENRSLSRVRLFYAFVDEAHRIFGDHQPMASHLLNAAVKTGAAGELTLYGYLLDYDGALASRRSSATFGAELRGSRKLGSGRAVSWELEAAEQRDAGDNPAELDAGYLHARFGAALGRVSVDAGWERLDGSAVDGQFNTPLATLHKWNGWADKFLVTPTGGLDDLYLGLRGKVGAVAWTATAHDFTVATGGADYGRELDVQLSWKASWGQVFAVKAALYDADEFSTDTEKVMFWTSYGF